MALTYLGATQIVPNYNLMGIAKAALEAAVRYLAFDLGDRGIRVNAISAGPIKTASSRQVGGFSRILDVVPKAAPLRRNVTAEDVGNIGDLPGLRSFECRSRPTFTSSTPAITRWDCSSRRSTPRDNGVRRSMTAIRRILIANRGEIAVRIIRTAREMGIATVAVYSDADRDALHVAMADDALRLGPAAPSQSYLDGDKISECARRSGADALHPGYGFFAENAEFARRVVAEDSIWIGPHAAAIDAMGDKFGARRAMKEAGVPLVPGSPEPIADAAAARRRRPRVWVSARAESLGRRRRKRLEGRAQRDEIDSAFATARREAEAYFKNGTIYAERYVKIPSTSNSSCSPIGMATWFTSANATALSSVDTRSYGRRRRRRSPSGCARGCARPGCARHAPSATIRPERSSVSSRAMTSSSSR